MRLRDIIICSVCIVIAAGLLICAGMQLDHINSQRKQMGLVINEPLENAPPSLAFATIATGVFRGLAVDILCMRAEALKEKGQFFDARQLAEWITTLQPRFASVWVFHAWNMAYNISVTIPATQPEQRWRWVKNGYELLRDQGIELNPKNIRLYHELARIFQHKIGSVSDDAHRHYKLQMALALGPLLGPADNQYFDALAEAPRRFSQIAADPNAHKLISALQSADKVFADKGQFANNYLSLRQNSGRFEPAAAKTIDDFRDTEALKKFDIFARAYRLRKTWKLEPDLMCELNGTFGPVDWTEPNTPLPLDWRHPDSHAIYWAHRGLKIAEEEKDRRIADGEKDRQFSMHETNTDRIVAHSLQNLFRNGKIFVYKVPVQVPSQVPSQPPQVQIFREVYLRPDLRMFEPYNKEVLGILEKYREDELVYESLQNGHRNMLKNALLSFYQSGHRDQAQKIYGQLKKLYPLPEFEVSLVEYARKRMLKELESIGINDAKEQIMALLRKSYYLYAIHDDDAAFGREKLAREIHGHYQGKYLDENRIDLPQLELLRYLALIDFLEDLRHPAYLRMNLLGRIKVERPEFYEQFEQYVEKIREQSEQQK